MKIPPQASSAGSGTFRLAKVRHALRTPINHIIGYAEILKEEAGDNLSATFQIDLDRIHGSGYVLMSLINRYLGEDCMGGAEVDVHGICHELRTPVNHIIGYGEMLAEQCRELDQTRLIPDLEKIIRAARQWLALMEEQLLGSPALLDRERSGCHRGERGSRRNMGAGAEIVRPDAEPATGDARGHLLLADDDDANRELLARRLQKLGYRVSDCANGGTALSLAQACRPDLILLDMLMPDLDGYAVLDRLKGDPGLRHIPVIMISALDEVESIARCIERGAEDYLAKPYNPTVLNSRISATLEKKRLRDVEQIYLQQLEEERARSELLLRNILPEPIARRLKQGETRIVSSFDSVTVLFADLVNFTRLATQMPPAPLVQLLDEIFSAFDELAGHYGLEKIKTIGDAYMAAAGVPFPIAGHAVAALSMARDMHGVLAEIGQKARLPLELRTGLSSGPVIAGIIGQSKFIYDLWGDTVNTASRMESHGLPGRIQLDEATYRLARSEFGFACRGFIEIKGKEPMRAYLIED